jgi:hypothetical protein
LRCSRSWSVETAALLLLLLLQRGLSLSGRASAHPISTPVPSALAPQELGLLAVTVVGVTALLFDGFNSSARAHIRALAGKSKTAGSAADAAGLAAEATHAACAVNAAIYFALFSCLATYILPGFASHVPSFASNPAIAAPLSGLPPALLLAAHGRKMF